MKWRASNAKNSQFSNRRWKETLTYSVNFNLESFRKTTVCHFKTTVCYFGSSRAFLLIIKVGCRLQQRYCHIAIISNTNIATSYWILTLLSNFSWHSQLGHDDENSSSYEGLLWLAWNQIFSYLFSIIYWNILYLWRNGIFKLNAETLIS